MDELVMMDYTWRREIYSRRKRQTKQTEKKREEKKRGKGLLARRSLVLSTHLHVDKAT